MLRCQDLTIMHQFKTQLKHWINPKTPLTHLSRQETCPFRKRSISLTSRQLKRLDNNFFLIVITSTQC